KGAQNLSPVRWTNCRSFVSVFFFQAEDGIRDKLVTGVQTCALPISYGDLPTLILESNSLLQFLKPSLYFAVLDPTKEDFKDSARAGLDRADALILRASPGSFPASPPWTPLPARLLREQASVSQSEGEPLPQPLRGLR